MSKRSREEVSEPTASLEEWVVENPRTMLRYNEGDRTQLLVCKRWHKATMDSGPDWSGLLHASLLHVLGPERMSTLSQRPHAYRADLALLCDSVVRQTRFDPELGARCVMLVQQYYDDCMPLGIAHHHWKDMRITFKEEGHLYTVMAFEKRGYVLKQNDYTSPLCWPSATGWLATLFLPFIKEERALACLNSPRQKDPTYKYYGMSYEQILENWDEASAYGTNRHRNMELCLNGLPHDTTGKEWRLWLDFKRDHIDGKLLPWRSEQILWSERLCMVGSDDITWIYADPRRRYDKDGRLIIVLMDFKFCEDVRHCSYDQQGGLYKFVEGTPDCNASRWGIQLHLYRTILIEYGYAVEPLMCDIVLHPSQKEYIKEDFTYDADFSRKMIAHRSGEVAKMKKVNKQCPLYSGVQCSKNHHHDARLVYVPV